MKHRSPLAVLVGLALLTIVLAATLATASGSSPPTTCPDVSEQFTGTATGVPDESLIRTSLESKTFSLEIGSADCQVHQLTATLSTSGAPASNYTNDADLAVAYEGIEIRSSANAGTDERVAMQDAHWGTYNFTVEAWSAIDAPYTLDVTADTAPASTSSGDNADDETVVVAVVDTGINPYHDEFSAESYPGELNLSEHPGTYLESYLDDAPSLNLSLGDPYDPAVAQDGWASVAEDQLYWIPGTKIVGAYHGGGALASGDPVIDDNGHGTASASVAVGNTLGSCERCLLVAVEGSDGLSWALSQPWIDFVSNSWSPFTNLGSPTAGQDGLDPMGFNNGIPAQTRAAVTRGQTVLFSASNGEPTSYAAPEPTYTSHTSGPDWVMTVGATDKFDDCDCSGDEGFIATAGQPVDVASYAVGEIPAADHQSSDGLTEHGGTSAATPIVAGVMGQTLLSAREALGDTAGGTHDRVIAEGAPVSGPHDGLLADGELTRAELEQAIKLTAQHTHSTWISGYPTHVGTAPVPNELLAGQFAVEGWGVVAERTGANATDVVLGEQPLPNRPLDQAAADADEASREALWGPAVEP